MQLSQTMRKGAIAVAALGALGLGGSALAGAAGSNGSTTTAAAGSTSGSGAQGAPAQGRPPDPTRPGGHVGADGPTEQALSGDVAAKVKAAAEKKVSGGTVLRVETDVDHGSPCEAHVRRADGTEVEVLVDSDFEVTAVETMRRP